MELDDRQPYYYYPDTDLDLSFTSSASDGRTIASSSARSSIARSSLTLSFNDRLSTTSTSSSPTALRQHRSSDPNWSAVKAATAFSSDGRLHLRHLKLVRLVGAGNLGRVFLCHLRDCSSAKFALKVVDRDSLTAKKLTNVQTEAEILSALDHPFLPTLYARIDASHYTCFLIDYCPNGDLHSLLRKQIENRLPVQSVRFFAAEVLVALEYLHALGIVYRDLKPENVLIREDGHIMLSDFDLCFRSEVVPTLRTARRAVTPRRKITRRYRCFGDAMEEEREEITAEFAAEPVAALSRSCVGTHEYLAPEIVSGNGHGNGVDWWAFGVFVYELLYGTTPFKGDSKDTTVRNIASPTNGVRFRHAAGGEEAGMAEARDLIKKLLLKDPRERLGCARGAQDIKQHPFFDGIKWPLIRHYRPPAVRGSALARKASSHGGHVAPVSPRRKRPWWKALSHFLRTKGASSGSWSGNRNNNYYHYVTKRKSGKRA